MRIAPRNALLAVVIAGATMGSLPTVVGAQPRIESATLARDVNGFELGMTLAEARDRATLSYIGGDQFEATSQDIAYNFGVTPKGRIYRVQSSQPLGQFAIDRSFLDNLGRKLAAKYGAPHLVSGETFYWKLTERITQQSGEELPFVTMWMSVYVGGSSEGRTLEMTILDFRILWADQAQANKGPSKAAADQLRF